MFSELKLGDGKRRTLALLASGVIHVGYFLFLILSRPDPIYVRPQLLAFGDGAQSHGPIYLALEQPATVPRTPAAVRIPKQAEPKRDKGPVFAHEEQTRASAAQAAADTLRAGSARGTLMSGPTSGRDIRPGKRRCR